MNRIEQRRRTAQQCKLYLAGDLADEGHAIVAQWLVLFGEVSLLGRLARLGAMTSC
ncbi:hypothetical protein [Mycobacterium sp. AZCC_0083]|uniref:hypothetical protein n=1 Tax=Mycobacterium sp. AZCC_0083 TaxID=2735882 RepID=UPI0016156F74|nr:hypothetical protein [Mycobacterium sp. AZCC_0083]MBB5163173.1 hypothetical protein [Mycobacterium sp. AZCC_0083]